MVAEDAYVLDTSAVLALLRGEPGAEAVVERVDDAVICAIHLGEALTKQIRKGVTPEQAERQLSRLGLNVVAWTEDLAWQSGDLCSPAWTRGSLSFADRACLAVARSLGRVALTADAAWVEAVQGLKAPVRVELIRPARSAHAKQ